MHAGRVRLRPILMTTFALIAGMTPVALALGEGGEFYRPMAVAIIGGTLTSTLLTLLVVPTFYDSIEISRDRAVAKFRRRAERWNPFLAFVTTLAEALLTLVMVRYLYRLAMRLFGRRRGERHPREGGDPIYPAQPALAVRASAGGGVAAEVMAPHDD